MKRGFSTLELLIALTIGSLIIVAVVSVSWGAQYWLIASRTSGEGLYIAKKALEEMRAASRVSFELASTSPYRAYTSCEAGELCYYTHTIVTDRSPCAKDVEALTEWMVPRYGTTSSVLHTFLGDANEITARGGDCLTSALDAFEAPAKTTKGVVPGTPMGLDVFEEYAYVATDAAPYLSIVGEAGAVGFLNGFSETVRLNAIDVARDPASGRTYAYIARHDSLLQFSVIDVTDPQNPSVTAPPLALPGVSGSFPQGWRLSYHDRRIYLLTRETAGKELHIIDVSVPSTPSVLGTFELTRTADDISVRTQYAGNEKRTFVFLPSQANTKEVGVVDVTDPENIYEAAAIDLPGSVNAVSVALLGNRLFIGRETDASGAELLIFNPANPLDASFVSQEPQGIEIGADVATLRVMGNTAFVGTNDSLQVWSVLEGESIKIKEEGVGVKSQLLDGGEGEGNAHIEAVASGSIYTLWKK